MGLFSSRKRKRKARRRARAAASRVEQRAAEQTALGKEVRGIYTETGAPLVKRYLARAQQGLFDPEQEAALASADVATAFERQAGQRGRLLQRFGLDPGDVRFRNFSDQLKLAQAATEAGLRNVARRQTRDLNFSRLAGAATFGQNLAGQASNILAGSQQAELGAADVHTTQMKQAGAELADVTGGLITGAGAIAGGTLGFMVGGPAGALAGAQIGAGLGKGGQGGGGTSFNINTGGTNIPTTPNLDDLHTPTPRTLQPDTGPLYGPY